MPHAVTCSCTRSWWRHTGTAGQLCAYVSVNAVKLFSHQSIPLIIVPEMSKALYDRDVPRHAVMLSNKTFIIGIVGCLKSQECYL